MFPQIKIITDRPLIKKGIYLSIYICIFRNFHYGSVGMLKTHKNMTLTFSTEYLTQNFSGLLKSQFTCRALYLSHYGTLTDSFYLSVSLSLKDSLVPIDSSSLNILHHSAGTYVSSVIYWTGVSGEHMNDNQAFVCP